MNLRSVFYILVSLLICSFLCILTVGCNDDYVVEREYVIEQREIVE